MLCDTPPGVARDTLKPNSSSKKTSWRHTKQDILQKKDYLRRETPHLPNTPREPTGPERIYWAPGPPGIGEQIGPGWPVPGSSTAGRTFFSASVFRIDFSACFLQYCFGFLTISAFLKGTFQLLFCWILHTLFRPSFNKHSSLIIIDFCHLDSSKNMFLL